MIEFLLILLWSLIVVVSGIMVLFDKRPVKILVFDLATFLFVAMYFTFDNSFIKVMFAILTIAFAIMVIVLTFHTMKQNQPAEEIQ